MDVLICLRTLRVGSNPAVCEYDSFGNILCGTYELVGGNHSESSTRIGGLSLIPHSDNSVIKPLIPASSNLPGILDIQISVQFTALVLSDGSVRLYSSDQKNIDCPNVLEDLKVCDTLKVSDGLCLAGAWRKIPASGEDQRLLAVTDSLGNRIILEICGNGGSIHSSEKMHDLEAWSVCWDAKDPNLIYTGGDDCALTVGDLRAKAAIKVKGHEAGVTSILSGVIGSSSLLTGCYDERIRSWDARNWKRPVFETRLPGGVWKIKACPGDSRLLACACMQGGAALVRITDSGFEEVEGFAKNRSLVYGIDWNPIFDTNADNKRHHQIAICSFYDKLLDIYHVDV